MLIQCPTQRSAQVTWVESQSPLKVNLTPSLYMLDLGMGGI